MITCRPSFAVMNIIDRRGTKCAFS